MASQLTNAEIEAGIKSMIWQNTSGSENGSSHQNAARSQPHNKKDREKSPRVRAENRPESRGKFSADKIVPDITKKTNIENPFLSEEQPMDSSKKTGKSGTEHMSKFAIRDTVSNPKTNKRNKKNKNKKIQPSEANNVSDSENTLAKTKSEKQKELGKNKDKVKEYCEDSIIKNENKERKKKKKHTKKKFDANGEDSEDGTPIKTVQVKVKAQKKTDQWAEQFSKARQDTSKMQGGATKEELEELANDHLFPLKKKNQRFPMALFFCRLCEYHCDNVTVCRRHMKDNRHVRLKVMKANDLMLKSLPPPSRAHAAVLTQLIEEVNIQQALSEADIHHRNEVLQKISAFVHASFPEVKLTVYGSTATGFGLKSSDLNIDVGTSNAAQVLSQIFLLLKDDQSGYYTEVRSDFSAKVPSIYFRVAQFDLKCQLSVNSSTACQTSQLLAKYSAIDPRVRKLAVAFRYWAKLCKVDQQNAGTLPSYAFGLMTIYFLQKCKPPVLPCLHEIGATEEPGKRHVDDYFRDIHLLSELWTCQNTESLGELWFYLLRFYSVQMDISSCVVCIREGDMVTREQKKWSSKKLAIEDPFAKKRNIARSVSHSHVFEYIYDRLRSAFQYFGIPQTAKGPVLMEVNKSKLQTKLQNHYKRLDAKQDVTDVSQITHSKASTKGALGHIKTAVEGTKNDPKFNEGQSDENKHSSSCSNKFSDKASIPSLLQCKTPEKCLDSDSIPASIQDLRDQLEQMRLATAEKFATTLTQNLWANSMAELQKVIAESSFEEIDTASSVDHRVDDMNELDEDETVDSLTNSECLNSETSKNTDPLTNDDVEETENTGKISTNSNHEDSEITTLPKAHMEANCSMLLETEEGSETEGKGESAEETDGHDADCSDEADSDDSSRLFDKKLGNLLTEAELIFTFSEEKLGDGKGPALMCSLCQREGHLKQACPEENLEPLPPLPPLTQRHKNMLDQVLYNVPGDFEPDTREVQYRNEILSELQYFIQELFPDARLSLFGSSCNGFGFSHSDLDICMTLEDRHPEELDYVEIIENLAKVLRRHRGLSNVLAITTAKVPIVKFRHQRSQLDGDISLYNTLAQRNTQMLLMYSQIDYRVKALGYTLKVLAKICDICDASRGSLNSYAYILMVLYYLQQRKPAVIPSLQELYSGDKPEVIVDNWNSWYFSDLEKLRSVWKGYNENRESLGELWIGLLCFYAEEFNYKDYVISCRLTKPLTRFEKLWNGRCIAIEDPFDLNHNLGAGVSRKMNMYIMKALRNARQLFGTSLDYVPAALNYQQIQDYLFDRQLLTEGEPPNDRGCRVCGKIGHFAKECPKVLARKERERQEKEKRQQNRETPEKQRTPSSAGRHGKSSGPQPIPSPVSHHRQQYQRSYSHGTPPHGTSPGFSPSQHYQHSPSTHHQAHGSPHIYNSPGQVMYVSPGSGGVFYNSNLPDSHPGYAPGIPPLAAHHPNQMHSSPECYTWQQQEHFLPGQSTGRESMQQSPQQRDFNWQFPVKHPTWQQEMQFNSSPHGGIRQQSHITQLTDSRIVRGSHRNIEVTTPNEMYSGRQSSDHQWDPQGGSRNTSQNNPIKKLFNR